jgi:hypothetical protein
MRVLGQIGDVRIYLEEISGIEFVAFLSDADIDCDGSGGNPDHDPYFQPDTSLHGPNGQPLNAYEVPFIVVPPLVCERTRGKVLGSQARVLNITNHKGCKSVVGDIGPRSKTGEVSVECARRLGLDPNPNHGGTSERIIYYSIDVGVPAVVDGVTYALKSYKA